MPQTDPLKNIVIMAGGTGGHVFPGIALAEAFAQKGITTHWLGTQGGLEANWVAQAGLPFSAISIKGLRGNGLKGWLMAPINVWRAFMQARRILKQQSPGLVIGMGGFVCGPGGLAARSLGIDLYLHEQNAVAGLTNKLLLPFAKRMFCGFEPQNLSSNKLEVIGNPVRASIEAVAEIEPHQPAKILVIGGSRGAQALNQALPAALALMPEMQRPVVLHQTGKNSVESTRQAYQQVGVEAQVEAFIEDMALAYREARLVVARSGALTIAELMASARPAILVPFPYAVDDHQTANAQVMQNLQVGQVIQQTDLTPDILAEQIQYWLQDEVGVEASKKIRQHANLGAAQALVDRVLVLHNQE
ncbi:MAG: undecaprenyldiphospho-muramoylpentapeptide beta-N-acetylglucosaminyltransferase [Thiomicrospira sp.]|uniref:undecaprenyldiphospho-muramoylpentapeptide beta-N-acetylglucosaminyltransferase n=1 Tax=Thiomicrospira sp. TaxID=935 RepID=UPI0019D8B0B8|nr:undecaprenyldiphospho-muramoylpentapeptide beta-N-acetylglucosaminyltransferase [Thiomicrospira sp.]MBE0493097.1 undecaprenyldiphospho-muramoylpentapeptide beta-N-acetylglucosaminyltransferase [Thiomicrospira sp.]